MVGIKEDRQVCARMLARDEGKRKNAKGQGMKEDKGERIKA